MQLSNISKIFIFAALCTVALSACGGTGAGGGNTVSVAEPVNTKTEPPYQNAEAETYQVEVAQTRGGRTDIYRIARKGDKWRVDNAFGTPEQTSSLHTDKDYVMSAGTKTYADFESGHGYDDRAATVEAVTGGLIGGRTEAVYDKVGAQDGKTIYRITGIPGKPSETLVTVDDKLGYPVLKELYKIENGIRTLDVTYKLNGFKTDVDDSLFAIPKDYKKVPLEEMRKTLVPPKQ